MRILDHVQLEADLASHDYRQLDQGVRPVWPCLTGVRKYVPRGLSRELPSHPISQRRCYSSIVYHPHARLHVSDVSAAASRYKYTVFPIVSANALDRPPSLWR